MGLLLGKLAVLDGGGGTPIQLCTEKTEYGWVRIILLMFDTTGTNQHHKCYDKLSCGKSPMWQSVTCNSNASDAKLTPKSDNKVITCTTTSKQRYLPA